jgi:hypothetical protein
MGQGLELRGDREGEVNRQHHYWLLLPGGRQRRKRCPGWRSAGVCGLWGVNRFHQWGDKTIALPPAGRNTPLPPPAVAHRLAYGLQDAFQCRIADELAWPHLLLQLLLGDHAVAME